MVHLTESNAPPRNEAGQAYRPLHLVRFEPDLPGGVHLVLGQAVGGPISGTARMPVGEAS